VPFTLKKYFRFFFFSRSEFGGTVCGCTFVILRGVIYLPLKNNFLEIFSSSMLNLSDHNKGKRHAIPIYSLIDYELPI
jgi:hypothetical protein